MAERGVMSPAATPYENPSAAKAVGAAASMRAATAATRSVLGIRPSYHRVSGVRHFGDMLTGASTHDVLNQPPPLAPYNAFEVDLPLREALDREGGGWGVDRLRDIGELAGSPEALEHAERAERNEPVLRTHDRYGNRIDEVELD